VSDDGIVASDVPFCYPMGCDMGCVVFAVFVSSPHRIGWVRSLQCCGIMMRYGVGCRYKGSFRAHYLARWGSAGFLLLCPEVYVMYSYYFYPRGLGLFLPLLPSVV